MHVKVSRIDINDIFALRYHNPSESDVIQTR